MVVAFAPGLSFEFDAHVQAQLPDILEGGASDPRHRTIVCRHWLKGLCQKGDYCEYLHQMDLDKMPICKWGAQCQARPNCMYRHIDEEERPDCIFYRQGFCKHGPACRFKHIKLSVEDIPETADFTLWQSTGAVADAGEGEGGVADKPEERPQNFKTSLCKHWAETGTCPFSTKCHFAHGQEELRKYRKEDKDRQAAAAAAATGFDAPEGGLAAIPPPPTGEMLIPFPRESPARYFVLKSHSYQNLGISAVHGKWMVQRKHIPVLNEALATCDQVVFLFSVVGSKQFQGCAVMRGEIDEVDGGSSRGGWSPEFPVEWLRLCEIPFQAVAHLENSLDDHIAVTSAADGDEIDKGVGRELLTIMFEGEEVKIPAAEELGNDLKFESVAAFDEENGPQFPVPKGKPGFIFVTGGPNLNECLAKLIFGMPQHQAEAASKTLEPGQLCFLLDITRRLIFGIFEVVSPLTDKIDPNFCRDGSSRDTPYPAQVKVRVVLEVSPVECSMPDLQFILSDEMKKRQSRLNRDQVQRLATLVAGHGGALNPRGGGGGGPPPRQGRGPPLGPPPQRHGGGGPPLR